MSPCSGAMRELHIGVVGVDYLALPVGHHETFGARVTNELCEIVTSRLADELQEPDGIGKERENPDDGQQGQETDDEIGRLILGKKRKCRSDRDETGRKKQNQARAPSPFRAIESSGNRLVGHQGHPVCPSGPRRPRIGKISGFLSSKSHMRRRFAGAAPRPPPRNNFPTDSRPECGGD